MSTLAHPGGSDNDPRILDGERLFLRVLLASPDRTASLTEATPTEYMTKPFPDGGQWRGAIPKRLAGRGIVGQVVNADGRPAAYRSGRKARNRGIVSVWKLLDDGAAERRLRDLDDYFARHPSYNRRPSLFDYLDDDPNAAGPVLC